MQNLPANYTGKPNMPAKIGPGGSSAQSAAIERTKGGTYQVWDAQTKQKKTVADAAGVNYTFRNQFSGSQVGTKILDAGKDNDKAWARVAGWIGPENNPIAYAEDYVCTLFSDMFTKLVFDKIEKDGIEVSFSESGSPVPSDPKVQLDVIRTVMQKRYFAERTAVTQARSRVQQQLLAMQQKNADWRDPEEIQSEQDEAAMVQSARKAEDNKFSVSSPLGFGKYKGKTIAQIATEDPGYLNWLKEKTDKPHIREAIESLSASNPAPAPAPAKQAKPQAAKPQAATVEPAPSTVHPADDIVAIVGGWPIDVNSQINAYCNILGDIAGEQQSSLADYDTALLEKIRIHIKKVDSVFQSALKSTEGDVDAAMNALNEYASISGFQGFFDPVLNKECIAHIEQQINQFGVTPF